MKFLSAFTPAVLCSINLFANSQEKIVTCHDVNDKKQVIRFKVDKNNDLQLWSENKLADTKKNSVFGIVSEDLEDFGFEYARAIHGKNGYSLIRAGTTADDITLGLSADLKKGFYTYNDAGSGNGDLKIVLTCKAK